MSKSLLLVLAAITLAGCAGRTRCCPAAPAQESVRYYRELDFTSAPSASVQPGGTTRYYPELDFASNATR